MHSNNMDPFDWHRKWCQVHTDIFSNHVASVFVFVMVQTSNSSRSTTRLKLVNLSPQLNSILSDSCVSVILDLLLPPLFRSAGKSSCHVISYQELFAPLLTMQNLLTEFRICVSVCRTQFAGIIP